MNALELRNQIRSGELIKSKKIILYGNPGSGKTEVAATAVRGPDIDKIYWLDLENGFETVLNSPTLALTDEELGKIEVINFIDSKSYPVAATTLLDAFTNKKGVRLDPLTGKKVNAGGTLFQPMSLGPRDLVVVDSVSQLADSIIALSMLNNTYKHLKLHYGDFTVDMGAIVSFFQAAQCNIIAISHECDIIKILNEGTKDQREKLVATVPLCGSRNFSKKFGKYFGYKLVTYMNGASYKFTAKAGEYEKTLASTRSPVHLYDEGGKPTLEYLFSNTPIPEFAKAAKAKLGSIKLKK